MDDTLHLAVLGGFRLSYGAEPVAGVDTPRMQALLAYVALHEEELLLRRRIAFSFWPDSTEKQAYSNLRNLIYVLRRAWPDVGRYLEVESQTLRWTSGVPVFVDVTAFGQALRNAEEALQHADEGAAETALTEAAALYRGELLPGCYDEWILPERERLHRAGQQALERLVNLLMTRRRYGEAVPYAQRLVSMEPLREDSHRLLMRLHALGGDRASALQTYQECRKMIEREFGSAPDPATQALYDQLTQTGHVEGVLRGLAGPAETETRLPLVGRHAAWRELRSAWQAAVLGEASLVTITGEAGIGKTRLMEELVEWARRQGHQTVWARAYAAEGPSPYAPVVEWLRAAPLQTAMDRLDAVWLAEIARLLPELRDPSADVPAARLAAERGQQRQLHEALARAVLAPAVPLLLALDDVQWCDRETLQWVRFLLRFAPHARLLVVGTVRIEEVGPDHPLHELLLHLRRDGQAISIELGPLAENETARLAAHVAGRDLGTAACERLHHETEGNALFVVESVRAGLHEKEARAPQPESLLAVHAEMPPTMQAVLTQRLAQLSPAARALAALAATVGRSFTLDVLAQASYLDEEGLVDALEELWRRRIVVERDVRTYDFTHEKLREVAYGQVSPTRRLLLHRRAAEALETVFADDLDAVSAQVAAHFDRGGLVARAVASYERAAQVARSVYAHEEAHRLLARARQLLRQLPSGPGRDERELALLAMHGPTLVALGGWATPEVGSIYQRAETLSHGSPSLARRLPVLWGLWTFHLVRSDLERMNEVADHLMRMAAEEPAPLLQRAAHFAAFYGQYHAGAFGVARDHLNVALSCESDDQLPPDLLPGSNLRIFCYAYAAHLLWHLGLSDQAMHWADRAREHAVASSNPFNEVIALSYTAMLRQLRREADDALEWAEAAAGTCEKHGFSYYGAIASIIRGWALAEQGGAARAIPQMEEGLNALAGTGTVLREPYYRCLLAEAYAHDGRHEDARAAVEAARASAARSGERWVDAELARCRGALLIEAGEVRQGEAGLLQSIDVARRQQALSLELRAALHLSRLLRRQERTDEARQVLTRIRSQFAEGSATPDLAEADEALRTWS